MASIDNEIGPEDSSYEPGVRDARTCFKHAKDFESSARVLFVSDTKFAEGDSDNFWQWPAQLRSQREMDRKPVLTVNKVKQHIFQIVNDIKQNMPTGKVKPVGNQATADAAQVYMGIVRRIQYVSNATEAYKTAVEHQVRAGWGYWIIRTDYIDEESFDQEIFIQRVPDPLMVYLDPDCQEADKSDAKFGFVFKDVLKIEFRKEYPDFADEVGKMALDDDGWVQEDHIRVAEFYRVEEKEDTLLAYTLPDSGQVEIMLASSLPKNVRKEILADPATKKRPTKSRKVVWKKIAGTKIVDETELLGRYIPIVMLPGEELVIDNQLYRKGHTRAMMDPQRMYNYWTSSATEQVALQGKSPWVASAAAIEGYEEYWNTANQMNYSVLPYNPMDDQGNKIDMPQRPQPPVMAPAYIDGMKIASEEVLSASGQQEPYMGGGTAARTGVAVQAQQRPSVLATYHFADQLAMAIRLTVKQIVELIPKVYDTKRVIQIMAQDGTTANVQIDPTAQQAFALVQARNEAGAIAIFNPKVGKYWVEADAGPGFMTKREQTANALALILTQNPQMASIIGDIFLRAMDFPDADEAAERLRRMVPKEALGTGPSQTEQALQQQLQQAQAMLQQFIEENATQKLQLKSKDSKQDVATYNAETTRFKALADAGLNVQQMQVEVMQLLNDMIAGGKPGDDAAAQRDESGKAPVLNADIPPMPGAQRAPDGNWYVAHQGGYARVDPHAGKPG